MKFSPALSISCLALMLWQCKTVMPVSVHNNTSMFDEPVNNWIGIFFQNKTTLQQKLNGPVKKWTKMEYRYLPYDSTGTMIADTNGVYSSYSTCWFNPQGALIAEESHPRMLFSFNHRTEYTYDANGRLTAATLLTDSSDDYFGFVQLHISYTKENAESLNYNLHLKLDSNIHDVHADIRYTVQEKSDTAALQEDGWLTFMTTADNSETFQRFRLMYNAQKGAWEYPIKRRFCFDRNGKLLQKSENVSLAHLTFEPIAETVTFYRYRKTTHGSSAEQRRCRENGESSVEAVKEFNLDGREIKTVTFEDDSTCDVFCREYNRDQKVEKSLHQHRVRDSIVSQSQIRNIYDNRNSLVEQYELLPDTTHHFSLENLYGQVLASYTDMRYNDKNQLIEQRFFTDSLLGAIIRYSYNEASQLQRRTEEFYQNGKLRDVCTYIFAYDNFGNMIQQLEYRNGILLHMLKQEFEYYH